MPTVEKYNVNLSKEIRQRVIEKQLNVLIGSGCSAISMPLLSSYYGLSQEKRNRKMIRDIIRISGLSIKIECIGKRAKKTTIGEKLLRINYLIQNSLVVSLTCLIGLILGKFLGQQIFLQQITICILRWL